jgi:hypothetical protein
MTQVCPVLGVAPVPALLSVICNPEAVVMVFPVVCAEAMVAEAKTQLSPAISANVAAPPARNEARIVFSLINGVAANDGCSFGALVSLSFQAAKQKRAGGSRCRPHLLK